MRRSYGVKQKTIGMLFALFIGLPGFNLAQDQSWRQFNGSVFSFRYPATWQLHAQVDSDAVVADTASPISVEFAVSAGQPASLEQFALNAEKHVSQFAQMNSMVAKFEGWSEIETGVVRVISHICSDPSSPDPHFCPSKDPKGIDVSSIIRGANGRIVLVQMMHKPKMSEAQINIGRQIVTTFKLK